MPVQIRFTPDARQAVIALGRGNAIAIVDTATRKTRAIVPVGPRVWGVAITPDGRRAISSDGLSDTVTVVDLASAKAVATVPVGRAPWGVVVR
jgi:YVTN family beta-propeller protein